MSTGAWILVAVGAYLLLNGRSKVLATMTTEGNSMSDDTSLQPGSLSDDPVDNPAPQPSAFFGAPGDETVYDGANFYHLVRPETRDGNLINVALYERDPSDPRSLYTPALSWIMHPENKPAFNPLAR